MRKETFVCLLLVALMPVCTVNGSRSILIDDSTGKFKQCATEVPCPSGYSCMDYPWVDGNKLCFAGGPFHRPGSCPAHSDGSSQTCRSDNDCQSTQKCCPSLENSYLTCQQPRQKNILNGNDPKVIVLVPGYREPGKVIQGSITLVQSKGKNIIVDQGTIAQKVPLLNALWERDLQASDIDLIVQTHGHLDHYSNGNLFVGKPINFDVRQVTGNNLIKFKLPYNIFNDSNVVQIAARGHTNQDTAVLVKNVPNYGTIAITGDLFTVENENKTDWATGAQAPLPLMIYNRRYVQCNADYIVPGHGNIFKISEQMKKDADCANLPPNPPAASASPRTVATLLSIFSITTLVLVCFGSDTQF